MFFFLSWQLNRASGKHKYIPAGQGKAKVCYEKNCSWPSFHESEFKRLCITTDYFCKTAIQLEKVSCLECPELFCLITRSVQPDVIKMETKKTEFLFKIIYFLTARLLIWDYTSLPEFTHFSFSTSTAQLHVLYGNNMAFCLLTSLNVITRKLYSFKVCFHLISHKKNFFWL